MWQRKVKARQPGGEGLETRRRKRVLERRGESYGYEGELLAGYSREQQVQSAAI